MEKRIRVELTRSKALRRAEHYYWGGSRRRKLVYQCSNRLLPRLPLVCSFYHLLSLTESPIGCATAVLSFVKLSQTQNWANSFFRNPIWVVNTRQTVRSTILPTPGTPTGLAPVYEKRLNLLQTILSIFRKDGLGAFFHGLGPALILVMNPILQFTVGFIHSSWSIELIVLQLFEQLKNLISARRLAKLGKGGIVPALSDLDFFLLGAVSKLFATGVTYPCPFLSSFAWASTESLQTRSYSQVENASWSSRRKIIQIFLWWIEEDCCERWNCWTLSRNWTEVIAIRFDGCMFIFSKGENSCGCSSNQSVRSSSFWDLEQSIEMLILFDFASYSRKANECNATLPKNRN